MGTPYTDIIQKVNHNGIGCCLSISPLEEACKLKLKPADWLYFFP